MIGIASIFGSMGGNGTPSFVEHKSVGTFLCFVKMPRVFIFGPPYRAFTRELTVTLSSTEVDPSTGLIPADEVVFRTRHIDRLRWGGSVFYEDKTTTGFTGPYTHSFRWLRFGYTPGPGTRKRFYDPFVSVLDPGIVEVSSPDFSPDTYLDAVRSDEPDQELEPSQYYTSEPDWCFFPVELKPGQFLTANTRFYEEEPVSYDATAGEYSTPFLDDSVPTSGPSGSEVERTGFEIPFSPFSFAQITLLRI
jgi:hypothetical protein